MGGGHMSNRIDKAIARAQAEGRVAFIGLVPIDPDSMERTRAVADMMIASGVDIVMVHIPNWMPWMEGGVLQLAARAPRNARVTRETASASSRRVSFTEEPDCPPGAFITKAKPRARRTISQSISYSGVPSGAVASS